MVLGLYNHNSHHQVACSFLSVEYQQKGQSGDEDEILPQLLISSLVVSSQPSDPCCQFIDLSQGLYTLHIVVIHSLQMMVFSPFNVYV